MDVDGLNDTKEGRIIYEEAIQIIKKDGNTDDLEKFIQFFNLIRENTYVCSFSSLGNQLSLWRGYGDVNIGFNYKELKNNRRIIEDVNAQNLDTSGTQLIPCKYIDNESKSFGANWIYKKFMDLKANQVEIFVQSFLLNMGQLLYYSKHLGFFEENEIRLSHVLWDQEPFLLRNGRRYIKYLFEPKSIKKIVIGPSLKQDENIETINEFIKMNPEFAHLEVYKSTIPFIKQDGPCNRSACVNIL